MGELQVDNPDFIEVYPGALDRATCAKILDRFERSGQATRGAVGSGVDTTLKDSWDIRISGRADWQPLHDAIQTAAFRGFAQYVRKYPHTLIAPLSLKIRGADGGLLTIDTQSIATLDEGTYTGLLQHAFRPGWINVQKYIADQGGYPYWHCEHYPKAGSLEPLHRVLLYTIYLNEGFGDGETEFLHQGRRIVPRTGDLLIAPAFFTHTHRGNRPRGKDKYIATSWILFQTAESLFQS